MPAGTQAVGGQLDHPGAYLVDDDPQPRGERRVGNARRELAADPPFCEKAAQPAANRPGRDVAAQPVQGARGAAAEEVWLPNEDGPAILGPPSPQRLAEGVQRVRRRIAVRAGDDPRCLDLRR